MGSETYSEMFDYYLLQNCACPRRSVIKTPEKLRERQKVVMSLQSCRRSTHFGRGWRYLCYIFVVVDGFTHERVWVISRILKEFPCNILPVLPDGWKICFPMELSVSDEPGRVEGGPEEFVLYDLQFLELRVGHVAPDRDAVHHCRSDYRSIDRYFVLCGQLASPANQRIKFSTNSLGALTLTSCAANVGALRQQYLEAFL
jgi:hypothetical protein